MSPKVIGCLLAALALPAIACEMPDEGNMPMRRAVTRVQMLKEVDAWAEHMRRSQVTVEYLVLLDAPVHRAGKCYWPVEVRAEGKLWRRFLVTPDGKTVLSPGERTAGRRPCAGRRTGDWSGWRAPPPPSAP